MNSLSPIRPRPISALGTVIMQCPIIGIASSFTDEKKVSEFPESRTDSGAGLQLVTFSAIVAALPATACSQTDSPITVSPALSIVGGQVGNAVSERVLAYLSKAESREPDAWLRDDYRIAWLTVLHCAEGMPQAWEFSFWQYTGKHPDKLIPVFVERAEKHRLMNIPDYDPTYPASRPQIRPGLLGHSADAGTQRQSTAGNEWQPGQPAAHSSDAGGNLTNSGAPRKGVEASQQLPRLYADCLKKQPSPVSPRKKETA